MNQKEKVRLNLRDRFQRATFFRKNWGKAAERLRGLSFYGNADTVFVSGGDSLRQVRINCLSDGKKLIMPAAGLKEGFFLIKPHSVPFRNISEAVTFRGLPRFGNRLTERDLSQLTINMLLTDALAIDPNGVRLGDGNGFFDLSYSLLGEAGALQEGPAVFAVVGAEQLIAGRLPVDPWDVDMTGVATSAHIHFFYQSRQQRPQIFWRELSLKRIRKIRPLWDLYQKKAAGPDEKS